MENKEVLRIAYRFVAALLFLIPSMILVLLAAVFHAIADCVVGDFDCIVEDFKEVVNPFF